MSVKPVVLLNSLNHTNVSKTVCTNKVTGYNFCKVSSTSQLVKSSTVSKPVRSNNASNSVIF